MATKQRTPSYRRHKPGGQAGEHAEAEAFTETIRAWRGSEALA